MISTALLLLFISFGGKKNKKPLLMVSGHPLFTFSLFLKTCSGDSLNLAFKQKQGMQKKRSYTASVGTLYLNLSSNFREEKAPKELKEGAYNREEVRTFSKVPKPAECSWKHLIGRK